MSPEDLESLEETLAVLSDPQLMDQLRESDDELRRGEPGMPLDELKVALAEILTAVRERRPMAVACHGTRTPTARAAT